MIPAQSVPGLIINDRVSDEVPIPCNSRRRSADTTLHGERVRSVLESEISSRPAEGTEMGAHSRPSGRERSTVTVRHESRQALR